MGKDTNYLEYNVNQAMKDGWELLGGVAVTPGGYFLQAMVR